MTSARERIEEFWDADAAVYDNGHGHHPVDNLARAAWRRTLERCLPPAPARVLDVGAGTGFLSLLAAELGHYVTAVDLSTGMLDRLRNKATEARLPITVVHAPAEEQPAGEFDAVMERHVLWTLPDPAGALRAWRAVAPAGRLVLLESIWGRGATPEDAVRARARTLLRRWRRIPASHHGEYPAEVRAVLPYGGGITPQELVTLVQAGGWGIPRVERLRDVEWAMTHVLPWPDRLFGATAPYLGIVADGPA